MDGARLGAVGDRHRSLDAPGASWLARALLIAMIALCINLAGNARTGLWDRDEPRYAVAVREMRASGNWLVPTFNGEPRYHKPILIYWLMGLGTTLGGDNPFGARLASALAGTGTCVLTWLLARRMLGARAGLLAGLMLAVAPIVVAESKLATTDATLAFWLVGCQCCLWELARRPSRILAGTFWALLGLAVLTKGPVAPVFLLAAGALAWWWGWPAAQVWRRLHPRYGLLGFALVTVPWYLAVAVITRGEFLHFAVGKQIVERVTTRWRSMADSPAITPSSRCSPFIPGRPWSPPRSSPRGDGGRPIPTWLSCWAG